MKLVFVAIGGGVGAVLRVLIQDWTKAKAGSLPLGTLLINISGAFLIALSMTIFHDRLEAHPQAKMFLIAGILGGYTTFSGLAWDAYQLGLQNPMTAVSYLAASFIGGGVAVALGIFLGKLA